MKDFKLLPLWVALFAGCIALFGNFYNGRQMLKLERKQFESNLILKSLVPDDSAQSIKNVRFLIKAGFISADNDKLISLIRDTVYHIAFPKADTISISPLSKAFLGDQELFSARIVDQNKRGIQGVKIHVFKTSAYTRPEEKPYATTGTDANGLFKVAVPDGKWIKIAISKPGYNGFVKSYLKGTLKGLKVIPLNRI
jgi:hypothetical protein